MVGTPPNFDTPATLTCESLVALVVALGTLRKLELFDISNLVARLRKVRRCQLPLLDVLSLRPEGAVRENNK